MNSFVVKILNIKDLTHNVKRFTVQKPQSYPFISGQSTMLAINKEGLNDKFHPFTFTSLGEDSNLEFIIKKYPIKDFPDHSGITEKIHELNIGDELIIKDPIGTIMYKKQGVFLAGGTGITPFISIFRTLKKKNQLDGNMLIFSNKERRDIILEEELKKIFDKKNLILTVSRERVKGYEYGRIDDEMINKYIKNFNQYFYICGPSIFEKDIIQSLITLGVDNERIVSGGW